MIMFIDISMHDELNERSIGADGITLRPRGVSWVLYVT